MIVLCVAYDILGAVGESLLYARAAQIIDEHLWAGRRLMSFGANTPDDDYPKDIQGEIT